MPRRIYIIEDHKMVREGLRLVLEHSKDFTVVGEAGTAAEGYAGVRAATPDLALIDINLPGESGLAAAARIRRDLPDVKVIAMTGATDTEAVKHALTAGVHGFLQKEDASEEMLRAIRLVLEGKIYLSPDASTAVASLVGGRSSQSDHGLTSREVEVLRGLAEGLSYKQIAERMHLGLKSVETYRARLVKKIGVSSRAEITRYAVRNGYTAL